MTSGKIFIIYIFYPMIILSDLSKKFDGNLAVDRINLKISEGEIVGLLGPNGAGKTTTLRMIAGVLPPSFGKVEINGKNMNQHGSFLKKMIGFLPENNPLYSEMTVEEFLHFWTKLKGIEKEKSKESIDFVVTHTGIAQVFYRPIGELSKGFRQRVGLSQALLTKPPILILDEPTEGLDPNQRREIKDLIVSLGKKRTVIISSHVLGEVSKICNRLIIIHKGKIVADSTPENLKKIHSGRQIIEAEIKGQDIAKTLEQIKGVEKVREVHKEYYVLECEKEKDLREEIFATSIKNKWKLLTLVKKEAELEDVFSQLTKE